MFPVDMDFPIKVIDHLIRAAKAGETGLGFMSSDSAQEIRGKSIDIVVVRQLLHRSSHMIVIVVEDDRALASTIIDYLEIEKIVCDYASDGVNALDLIRANNYQVIILDINLPRIDGLNVCKQLRADGNTTPIIMLTAKDKLDDKLNGFRVGADDYLVKPFAMDELVARIRALSGRLSGQTTKISVGDLTLDLDQNIASRGDRALKLSPTAFKLLEILMRASPRVVSKQILINSVWGNDYTDANNLKVHIHHIRKQVDHPEQIPLVHTIKSSGYAVKPAYEN